MNTELRSLSDPRVFDWIDYMTLDDGERPFLNLLAYLLGKKRKEELVRTFYRENHRVTFQDFKGDHDIPQKQLLGPCYEGLKLDQYLNVFEMLNPMHRIWSDGRWNKLTLAHGCYWKKCAFCDTSLDYISRYEPSSADLLVDRMEKLIENTGQSGFHFVDEAAPPAILKALAQKILERRLKLTWWGNIRFEQAFTPELAELLARSGCIAMSGGLEVASDRLLKLMNKGVSIEQVAQVTQAFSQSKILVHAYLMYGFPTQTEQETIDALERVRQLFYAGCIQSGHWHRFSVTVHSPIGKNPEKYGIRILHEGQGPHGLFSQNDLAFEESGAPDHDLYTKPLKLALYNYMQGSGFDWDVRSWFAHSSLERPKKSQWSKTTVPADLIEAALKARS